MSLISKVGNLMRAIKQNGGIVNSAYTLLVTDDLKWGTHVGTDKYGNKYYENNYYFVGRNRWVIYNKAFFVDYDGSQIPAEWHAWMHYTTDLPPTVKPPVNYKWMVPHQENKTGTSEAYFPYSTTRTKVQSWMPQHLRGADYDETTSQLASGPSSDSHRQNA
ncbi:probable NADH dehydrogenase [ubiquinone] 1 alpha subcomplex subunit 12 [Paramacrobiotus metropolitanus]|uniref:probable NADH dehydrogenase [ubiquinone] 1 alpha subcomplex subunit 12 n=1 Tax=Paramacrobiotus metropolitanus TaxID=2943436 RepID=UPI0024459667|nr:probable NADH dehydrogenase [ubiquinone] 1 alpha subcomplex subunit 12 [Paramacrobiotus metropolitanus]